MAKLIGIQKGKDEIGRPTTLCLYSDEMGSHPRLVSFMGDWTREQIEGKESNDGV